MDHTVTLSELTEVMDSLGMSSSDAADYQELVEANLSQIPTTEDLAESPRTPSGREFEYPAADDNPLGAWHVRTRIQPTGSGKLNGRTVALKDNVLLADVPLMNGTSILEGYTPTVDAEIVNRILDAGGTITGKTTCEAYCFSGGSHTSSSGYVRNPHNHRHSAGGSSSGSGALVASGDVDMAVGCDQGGSVRMPASFCGIVGMKPTHGLVPYTGILGMNPNIDHAGPMTSNVKDNALFLEVLAGPDGVDSRQARLPESAVNADYTSELGQTDLNGLRIGLLTEGFGRPSSEQDVDSTVRSATAKLAKLGASVSEISIPVHARAGKMTFGAMQAMLTSMFTLDGCVLDRPDVVPPDFIEAQRQWRTRADELPANVKSALITNEFIRRRHGYVHLARAMQQVRILRRAYDDALQRVDLLVLPTTPMQATPLPPEHSSPEVVTIRAFEPTVNTQPFNTTHHPALSIPVGFMNGLPVGMMFVGRHFDEARMYRVAYAFEQAAH